MQILCVSVRYPTLLQTWLINYLQSMEKAGANVHVISLFDGTKNYNPKIDQLTPVPVWTAKIGRLSSFVRWAKFWLANLANPKLYRYASFIVRSSDSVKEFINGLLLAPALHLKPDVIHCHSEKAAYRLMPLLRFYKKPIMLTFHGLTPDGVKEISTDQRKRLYSFVSLVLVNTKFAANQCESLIGRQVPHAIVPQGIDLDDFDYNPAWLPQQKNLVVLTVGRLDRLKGHIYGIDAIVKLRNMGFKVNYWIVGSGLYESELKDYIQEKGAEQYIRLRGTMTGDHLKQVYKEAHIFLLPSFQEKGSWAETQGIVLQEAQACGKIVIASNSGGIPECITDGKTGFLVEQKSSESIFTTLSYILNNSKIWSEIQQNARQDVEKRFSLDGMSENLLKAYKSLM